MLTGLDDLPRSLLFYRQLLQWFGGMGIIVLAVAILPMLGIGGMQLYRAESPGPVKDSKLTPRITETAKALWYIYLTLTVACALAYYLCGMSVYDAICHAFSTVAIGGFSTHDQSLGYFDSQAIESVAMVFMVLAGINFGLHFTVANRKNPLYYFRDWEVRTYLGVLSLVAAIVVIILLRHPTASDEPIRGRLVSRDIHSDHHRFRHHRLLAVAFGRTGVTAVRGFCRRLRGFHRGRDQDHSRAAALPAGLARGQSADSSQWGIPHQAGTQPHPRSRDRGGLELLCRLRDDFFSPW